MARVLWSAHRTKSAAQRTIARLTSPLRHFQSKSKWRVGRAPTYGDKRFGKWGVYKVK